MSNSSPQPPLAQRAKGRLIPLLALTAAMWALLLMPLSLREQLGIRPGATIGLAAIPAAPWLHADLTHLASNTIPFLVLGALVLLRSSRDFVLVTLLAVLGSGLGIWFLGDPSEVHLGASGVIFGYFGFLVARGLLERTFLSLALAAAVGFFYGGLLWQVFPHERHISWQAHVFGLLSGLVAAWLIVRRRLRRYGH